MEIKGGKLFIIKRFPTRAKHFRAICLSTICTSFESAKIKSVKMKRVIRLQLSNSLRKTIKFFFENLKIERGKLLLDISS